MNTILASALGGAVGGALGALIGAGIEKLWGDKKKTSTGKVASFIGLLFVVGGARLGATLAKPSVESQIDQIQVYATIHRYFPDDYANMVSTLKESQSTGNTTLDIQNKIRPQLSAIIAKRVSQISNENMAAIMALTIDEARVYETKDPHLCNNLFNGKAIDVDPTSLMGPDLVKRDLDTSNKILIQLATAPAAPARPISEPDALKLALSSVRLLPTNERQLVVSMLTASRQASTEPEARAYCDFTIALMQKATSAPTGTLRSLLAAEASSNH